jgi:hypothetical protein
LWPWADILRQLVGSDHALADFSAESPGESAAAQFGQAAAVAEVIRRIASRERLLVVMEDLQWAMRHRSGSCCSSPPPRVM